MSAGVDYGGLMRCCATAIPVTDEGPRDGAGNERHECPHGCPKGEGGVQWSEARRMWVAGWKRYES